MDFWLFPSAVISKACVKMSGGTVYDSLVKYTAFDTEGVQWLQLDTEVRNTRMLSK